MKSKVLMIFVALSLVAGAYSFYHASAEAGVQVNSQTPSKKRCEKCYRGPDGEMVCEEVECPDE